MEHLVVSHRRGSQSVERRTGNRLHSNADEGGQKRVELSCFLEQPGGSGLCVVVRLNLTGISSPKKNRTEKDINRLGSSSGADIFSDKTLTHLGIPNPGDRVE